MISTSDTPTTYNDPVTETTDRLMNRLPTCLRTLWLCLLLSITTATIADEATPDDIVDCVIYTLVVNPPNTDTTTFHHQAHHSQTTPTPVPVFLTGDSTDIPRLLYNLDYSIEALSVTLNIQYRF